MWRAFDFFRVRDLPPMTRLSYLTEVRYFLLWGIVVGAMEGNLAGAVAKKTFDAPDWLASVVWAMPVSMNMLNLLWGVWLRGRRVIHTLSWMTVCATACIASIAFTSREWGVVGAYVFALQIAATHVLLSGLLSLRVSIWKANYPQTHRAKITGRLQGLRFLVIFVGGAVVSGLFDLNPDYYRFVYPTVALIGLVALRPLRTLRIRGEAAAIRAWALEADSTNGRMSLWQGLREAAAILRDDRTFRLYMVAQMLLGSANFFTDAALLTALVSQIGLGYYTTNLLMIQIPVLLMLLSIPFWAGYFDRVGVLSFRVRNSALWLISYTCVTTAMLLVEHANIALWVVLTLLVIGRLVNGVCRGGGSLAWTLGHLEFARPNQSELYLGIHVALTGVRGLLVPLISAGLNAAIGNVSFLVAIGLTVGALGVFARMASKDPNPSAGAA